MKFLVFTLLISFNAVAGEFFCRAEGKALLKAVETAEGLRVTAYGELAADFESETHVFAELFSPRSSRGQYQSWVEGNEHHVWIYELRMNKNPAKTFKAWLNVFHDEMGADHGFELDCVRTKAPIAVTLVGRVTEVTCGEIDPFEVGDACVLEFVVGSQTFGVLTEIDHTELLESLKGKAIEVPSFALAQLSVKKERILLEDINAAATFFSLVDPAALIVR